MASSKHYSDAKFLQVALKHGFLDQASVDRLPAVIEQEQWSVELAVMKKGLMSPWQVETVKLLCDPDAVVPGYRVSMLLGRGGFGSVFRATQTAMDREVALKTIPMRNVKGDSTARRFEREAKIVGQLRHPHIVAAYDFGILEDRLFLSLELVEGFDLGVVLKRVGRLDEVTTWHIVRQTVTALAYAAEHDVTHRDIKPGNLLMTKPLLGYALPPGVPMVKVLDFGLACFTESRAQEGITLENAGLGTPSYVAPEQLRGRDVDERSDIYSLGATAFHAITGVAPYANLLPMEVAKEKLSGQENWQGQLGAEVSDVTRELIAKMSATDVDARFSGHTELLVAVDDALERLAAAGYRSNVALDFSAEKSDFFVNPNPTMAMGEVSTGDGDDFDVDSGCSAESLVTSSTENAAQSLRMPLRLVLYACVPLLVIGAIAAWYYLATTNSASIAAAALQPDRANVVRSFDGLKLDYSKFKLRTGGWSPESDSEGGNVLAGQNCRVVFPSLGNDRSALPYFQFSIGVYTHSDIDVTFHVDQADQSQSLFQVSLDPQGVQVLRKSGQRLVAVSQRIAWEIEPGKNTGYSQILIARQLHQWTVYRDSDLIGSIDTTDAGPAEIMIVVVGKTIFESPEITPLIPVQPNEPQ